MNKEMIISSGDHETRVAILEDDQVVEIFIERERSRGVVGNIYKGRVSKVLPGMQSSFVDIGLERDAFLYVTEVVNTVEEFERLESGDDEDEEPIAPPVLPVPPEALAAIDGAAPAVEARRPLPRRRTAAPAAIAAAAIGPAVARRSRPRAARAENRGPAEGRAGDPRPGGQGAARHQGRAPDLARHACRGASWSSCRPSITSACRARSSRAKSARGCAASSKSFREQHGFTGGVIIRTAAAGRSEEDIVSRPRLLPSDLDRDPPEDGSAPRRRRCCSRNRAWSSSCCATC